MQELRDHMDDANYDDANYDDANFHNADPIAKPDGSTKPDRSTSPLGDPIEIARAASQEFRSRSYWRRQPRVARLTASSLLTLLLAIGGLLMLRPATLTGQYIINARLEGLNGRLIAEPTLFTTLNRPAYFACRDGDIEYAVAVTTGDGSPTATHTFELTLRSTDKSGSVSSLIAPRIRAGSNSEVFIAADEFKLLAKVSPAAQSR
jgi:hypothetical protein